LEIFLQSLESIKRPDVEYEEGEYPFVDVNNIRYIASNTFSHDDCSVSSLVLYGDSLPEVIDMVRESLPELDDKYKEYVESLIRRAQLYMASRDESVAELLHNTKLVEFTTRRIDGPKLTAQQKQNMLKNDGFRRLTDQELHKIESIIVSYNLNEEDLYYQQASGILKEKRGG
jgi:hypothetical protein